MLAFSLGVTFGSCRSLIYGLGGLYFHLTEDGSNYVMKPDDEEDHTVYFNNTSKPANRWFKVPPMIACRFLPTHQAISGSKIYVLMQWNEVDDPWGEYLDL